MTNSDQSEEKLEPASVELNAVSQEHSSVAPASAAISNESSAVKLIETNSQPWKRRMFLWDFYDLEDSCIHAGFWQRLSAHLVDWAIVNTITSAIVLAYVWFVGLVLHINVNLGALFLAVFSWLFSGVCTILPVLEPCFTFVYVIFVFILDLLAPTHGMPEDLIFLLYFLINCSTPFLIDATYHAVLESGSHQATIGKMLFHMYVTDEQGKRLTVLHAYRRYFAKILSSISLGAGFIAIGRNEKKQGFHDRIAKTYVLRDYDPKLLQQIESHKSENQRIE